MIAIDWGTTNLRAFRIDADGNIVGTRHSAQGVLAAAGNFESVLRAEVDGWDDALIVMSGMIGSRQGWREVAYVACPAGLDEIAAAMVPLAAASLPGRQLWLVPGLSVRDERGARDVMRGEEAQICGLVDALGAGRHRICLPGTHSKHVEIRDGRVERFHTAMTGELFDMLCKHSILGRLMGTSTPHRSSAFLRGVDDARQPRDLLNQLFAVRTLGLFGTLQADELPSYLSGLLIGHELNDMPADAGVVHLVGSPALLAAYEAALALRRSTVVAHSELASAYGCYVLARRRGLLADQL